MDIAVLTVYYEERGSADTSVLAQNGQQTPLITLSFVVKKSRFVALYIVHFWGILSQYDIHFPL